ncbi:MAG: hypothetical protein LM522_08040, partial [Candidatus Contendobacter sp.]|nr:hypothetical protein [Candidatus Contendobacter sp.]
HELIKPGQRRNPRFERLDPRGRHFVHDVLPIGMKYPFNHSKNYCIATYKILPGLGLMRYRIAAKPGAD